MYCLKSLPGEPAELAEAKSLAELGYIINENNQIIKIATAEALTANDTGFPSLWDHPDKDRLGLLKHETLREAVRVELQSQLTALGVNPIYLNGLNGTNIAKKKPHGQHIPILVSDDLKNKRSVILVVGEHTHDLAILSWYRTLREFGINRGTVIGLIKHLAAKHKHLMHQDSETVKDQRQAQIFDEIENAIGDMSISNDGESTTFVFDLDNDGDPASLAIEQGVKIHRGSTTKKLTHASMPGIIVLNPGQRFYSHHHNKTFTQDAWFARIREDDQIYGYKIDDEHNLVPGHKKPEEHVHTFCTSILPQLVDPDCKIFVIAIGDGGTSILSSLARQLTEQKCSFLNDHIKSIALLNCVIDVESEGVMKQLLNAGYYWKFGDQSAGTIIDIPANHRYLLASMKRLLKDSPLPSGTVRISVGKNASKKFISAYNQASSDQIVPTVSHDVEEDEEDAETRSKADTARCECLTLSCGPTAYYTESILPVLMEEILEHFDRDGLYD